MAVQRVPGCGFETPTAEELPFEDFEVQAVGVGLDWGLEGEGSWV